MAINKLWHLKNKMPLNATFEERLEWHKEHAKNCKCKKQLPRKLRQEMIKRNIKP